MKNGKLLVTGISGVLGTFFRAHLDQEWEIVSLTRVIHGYDFKEVLCDITQDNQLEEAFRKENPDVVLHLAAATHIDRCESDRVNGKNGIVWRTNVASTTKLVELVGESRKRMILMSTECVFDGEKELYFENDAVSPKNWYGVTKVEAEAAVRELGSDGAVLRSVIAYGQGGGKTIIEKLLANLRQGIDFEVVSDQKITPTYIPKIYDSLHVLLNNPLSGVFHAAPQDITTPAEMAYTLARQLGINTNIIHPVTMEEYFGTQGASLRLKNSCLSSEKSNQQLGVQPHTLREVLRELDLSEL